MPFRRCEQQSRVCSPNGKESSHNEIRWMELWRNGNLNAREVYNEQKRQRKFSLPLFKVFEQHNYIEQSWWAYRKVRSSHWRKCASDEAQPKPVKVYLKIWNYVRKASVSALKISSVEHELPLTRPGIRSSAVSPTCSTSIWNALRYSKSHLDREPS